MAGASLFQCADAEILRSRNFKMSDRNNLSDQIHSEGQLDEILTRPSDALPSFIKQINSPLVILGAGGKMGPTLAVLAKRAAEACQHPLEVIAVSRFSDAQARRSLEKQGIETRNCDLLNDSLRDLPDAQNLIYLVGLKSG